MKLLRKAGAVLLTAALSLPGILSFEAKAAEPDYVFLTAYTSNGTFTPTHNGLYKIYCVGKSGNGVRTDSDGSYQYYGGGGGGSGGIAVSSLRLDAGTDYDFTVTPSKTSWNGDELYATAGSDGSERSGGSSGQAYGGNIANDSGTSGGYGGSYGNHVAGSTGGTGGNGGMKGGDGGTGSTDAGSGQEKGGGGGGGGARLPDAHCSYVAATYTASYTAANGGQAGIYDYHSGHGTTGTSANSYPGVNINNPILYGGGGGAGGKSYATYGSSSNGTATGMGGSPSSGTPGVLIIEECSDTTPPTIDSIVFSQDRKSVTITGSDEYGVAGFYVNGEFQSGNPLTYSIPAGTVQLTIQAEDNAGNQSEEQVADVLPAAPTVAVLPDKTWLNAADGNATVSLSTDAAGIFEDVQLWYSLNGGADWTLYSAPFEVSETSTVSAKVSCTNGESEPAQKEIRIDSLPPSVTFAEVDETDMENRFLTVTAADTGGSGVKGIWIDKVMWADNPAVYYIPDDKDTVTLQVEDVAGNLSESVEQIVRHIDTIPPTIDSVEFTGDLSVVTIRMSDDTYGYGVKGVSINGVFKTGNPILWAVPEDLAILYLQAEDNSGNQSEIRREHVPGRSAILDTITIESVEFSDDNTTATIMAATSEPGTSITGIYCNDELVAGNPVTYTIPADNSQYLKVQAVNNEGDKSELVTKRIPGWSEVVDTIAVTSVEFLNDNKLARVRADTTRLNASILGIYVNSMFYEGNPIECAVTSGTEYLECQAVDDVGDLSQPVVREIPKKETTSGGGSSHHSSGGGTGSTTRITISEPVLQKNSQYRVDITATDSECEIEKIVAVWDGRKQDITKSNFLLLDNDTLLQVIAENSDGRRTYKKVRIQLKDGKPVVEDVAAALSQTEKQSNSTAQKNAFVGAASPADGNSADTESPAGTDPQRQLEELLRRQQLRQTDRTTNATVYLEEVPETVYRTRGSSNRPGAAVLIASGLCFLALMALIVLLVRRQHKQSAYCMPEIPKK